MGKFFKVIAFLIILAGASYTGAWFYIGGQIKTAISSQEDILKESIPNVVLENVQTTLSGFPKEFIITWAGDVKSENINVTIPLIRVKGWFAPGRPIDLSTPQGFTTHVKGLDPVTVDRFDVSVTLPKNWPGQDAGEAAIAQWQTMQEKLEIHNFEFSFKGKGMHLKSNGYITLDNRLQPAGIVTLILDDVSYVENMNERLKAQFEANKDMSAPQKKKMAQKIGLLSMITSAKDLSYTLRIVNNAVYLSFLKILPFKTFDWSREQQQEITAE
jgi:hypothetical protein